MNKSHQIVLGVFVLLALLGWLCFSPPLAIPLGATTDVEKSPKKISRDVNSTGSAIKSTSLPNENLSVYKTDPKWILWNEQNQRDPSFQWKMPIAFYGKAIDQNDQPIEGVSASFNWTDLSPSGTSTAVTQSDAAGIFKLTGVKGKFLQIRLQKDGYSVFQGNSIGFEFAAFFESDYYDPDPEKPVVFRLWKHGDIPKDLIVRETMMKITSTGQPHFIDLRTTRKSGEKEADISIKITKELSGNIKKYQYNWSASIEGVNGAGLIESEEEFMFDAPKEGYEPSYRYQFLEGAQDWSNHLKRKYFIRAEGKRLYARVDIEFIPSYQDSGAIDVRFFVNPSGSTNLEYIPFKTLPQE